MYEILLILMIILCIFYTIDNKPLNIVIDFILIIIYASALAILFGLIMMLFNNIYNNTNKNYTLLFNSKLSQEERDQVFRSNNFISPLKMMIKSSKYNIIIGKQS